MGRDKYRKRVHVPKLRSASVEGTDRRPRAIRGTLGPSLHGECRGWVWDFGPMWSENRWNRDCRRQKETLRVRNRSTSAAASSRVISSSSRSSAAAPGEERLMYLGNARGKFLSRVSRLGYSHELDPLDPQMRIGRKGTSSSNASWCGDHWWRLRVGRAAHRLRDT